MASTSKLSFRARNLDAGKSMPIYFAEELPDLAECAPINRAVAQMPTGMEKDEEMESHLQEAILAQQACTSGVAVENHVIPTPKVYCVGSLYYDTVYPEQPAPSVNQLIKVQASIAIEKEQPEYDIDTEDECWLGEHQSICMNDFEKMMELLEGASSDLQICQPKEAQMLLRDYDDDLTDDVYDYWLQKRKDVAARRNCSSLIPKVKCDSRRDGSGATNPYIAFRRRAEKMQTRKNRKNDEDSYERILKLGHDLARAAILFNMVRKREQTKLALIRFDEEILKKRWELNDVQSMHYNQLISRLKYEQRSVMERDHILLEPSTSFTPTKVKTTLRRKKYIGTLSPHKDEGVVSRTWLKKNAEIWNRPPQAIIGSGISGLQTNVASGLDKSATGLDSTIDGRYSFKRRRGCLYRRGSLHDLVKVDSQIGFNESKRWKGSFVPSSNIAADSGLDRTTALMSNQWSDRKTGYAPSKHFYRLDFVKPPSNNTNKQFGFFYARRRLGRGGRIIIDRIIDRDTDVHNDKRCIDTVDFCDVNSIGFIDLTKNFQCTVKDDDVSDNEKLDMENDVTEDFSVDQMITTPNKVISSRLNPSNEVCYRVETKRQRLDGDDGGVFSRPSVGEPKQQKLVLESNVTNFRVADGSGPSQFCMRTNGSLVETSIPSSSLTNSNELVNVSSPTAVERYREAPNTRNTSKYCGSYISLPTSSSSCGNLIATTVVPTTAFSHSVLTTSNSPSSRYKALPSGNSICRLAPPPSVVHYRTSLNYDQISKRMKQVEQKQPIALVQQQTHSVPVMSTHSQSQSVLNASQENMGVSSTERTVSNGVKRLRAGTISQLSSLHMGGHNRQDSMKINVDPVPPLDAKRLELAIVGSGTRIKPSFVSSCGTSVTVQQVNVDRLQSPVVNPNLNVQGGKPQQSTSTCTLLPSNIMCNGNVTQIQRKILETNSFPESPSQSQTIPSNCYVKTDGLTTTSANLSRSLSPVLKTESKEILDDLKATNLGNTNQCAI